MGEWKNTACALCSQNCGLEVFVENNQIVKVRGEKDNPRSRGYVCRKGMNIAYHQHTSQRLTHPLKRVGDSFQPISWEQAIEEIAEKLQSIVTDHGPRSIAYMGGGGQACHFESAFGLQLFRKLGSRNWYNALAQELTGEFWVQGRATGKQYLFAIPDEQRADMFLATGWNGMVSHQVPRAPLVLREFSKNPDKLLVVIDPRKSETAQIADIHLPIRPGTDALLMKAMITIILDNNWQKSDYINKYVDGFDKILPWFEGFDAREAVRVCGLDYEQVKEVAHLFATRKSCLHGDLGVLMNRHSTANSYLQVILMVICGRFCVPGGNVIPGYLMPLGGHSDERNPKSWRTLETDFPMIMGMFPPNVMPEEIMSEHPEHLRAVIVTQSNPLRAFADTTAYEEAFKQLDLLVTMEMNMTETAVLSHYILPSRSAYESWDSSFFSWNWPEVYFKMRRPVVDPEGEPLEMSQFWVRLADQMGFIPSIPDSIYEAANGPRKAYAKELLGYLSQNPEAAKVAPFVIAKTLGKAMDSANLASLWGILLNTPQRLREDAIRAGFADGPWLGDDIFQSLMDHPEGIWIGKSNPDNMSMLKTENGLIQLGAAEMAEWIKSIEPETEEQALKKNDEYPFILLAGRHTPMNANNMMRNPEWNQGKRACTLAMNPADAEKLGMTDGQMVQVRTEAGTEKIELEIKNEARVGQVIIPHGFGLVYDGQVYGINVNRLSKNTHRDRFAATPLHRYVPCSVELLSES